MWLASIGRNGTHCLFVDSGNAYGIHPFTRGNTSALGRFEFVSLRELSSPLRLNADLTSKLYLASNTWRWYLAS